MSFSHRVFLSPCVLVVVVVVVVVVLIIVVVVVVVLLLTILITIVSLVILIVIVILIWLTNSLAHNWLQALDQFSRKMPPPPRPTPSG